MNEDGNNGEKPMDDNKFFLSVIKTIVAGICLVFVSFAGCTANRHYQTRVLIESGKTDAIGAKCAIDADASTTCLNMAIRDMVGTAGRK